MSSLISNVDSFGFRVIVGHPVIALMSAVDALVMISVIVCDDSRIHPIAIMYSAAYSGVCGTVSAFVMLYSPMMPSACSAHRMMLSGILANICLPTFASTVFVNASAFGVRISATNAVIVAVLYSFVYAVAPMTWFVSSYIVM